MFTKNSKKKVDSRILIDMIKIIEAPEDEKLI